VNERDWLILVVGMILGGLAVLAGYHLLGGER
jgi:hypothetical protein